MSFNNDTIVALSTPQGIGAIGVIRLSGKDAIAITEKIFSGKKLSEQASHTIHFGKIINDQEIIDEVVASIFKAPHSYTTENVIEISCHGSSFILQKILQLLVQHGARLATAGEFTQRAFLNGRFDLSQAEAVADLIAAETAASHKLALQQMRGGFSNELKELRQRLIDFTALLELELDFGEEHVEFANRLQLTSLINDIQSKLTSLAESFNRGNVIRNGIPTAIIGKPNAGKSTLLNALLNDEKAIVSHIPGTTRDVVEDRLVIDGILFRLMDTAGLRKSEDSIEQEGIRRSMARAQDASLVLYVFDLNLESTDEAKEAVEALDLKENVEVILIANKVDLFHGKKENEKVVFLSAKNKTGLDDLVQRMKKIVSDQYETIEGHSTVSNVRHYEALLRANESLQRSKEALEGNISGEFIIQDLRETLQQIGSITGEVSNDDILGSIFSKFCIGK